MENLKVGDEVMWRGGFGYDAPQKVKVTGLELTEHPRSKYGEEVDEVSWAVIEANRVVFSLANNSWCYAEQISPVK